MLTEDRISPTRFKTQAPFTLALDGHINPELIPLLVHFSIYPSMGMLRSDR
jgi:hypothetical protein